MKPDNYLPPDPMDVNLSRWLKNWVTAVQPTRNVKFTLMEKLGDPHEPAALMTRVSSGCRWFMDNLLLKPLDLVFEPMLCSPGFEGYPRHYHNDRGSTLVMHTVTHSSFPYGIGQFNLVT
jgi:hypothetical protein